MSGTSASPPLTALASSDQSTESKNQRALTWGVDTLVDTSVDVNGAPSRRIRRRGGLAIDEGPEGGLGDEPATPQADDRQLSSSHSS